jgi:hypothetical protein
MRTNRISVLGGLLVGALAVVGCSKSSSSPSGTGGAGAARDAGVDRGTGGTVGTGGAGGTTDAGADRAGGQSGSDAGSDAGADAGTDAGADAGMMACTTTFGAGNPVQFAFNGGANAGWYQYVSAISDLANSGLTTSLGASFTDGHSCPGALQFGVNFTAYGPPNAHGESGATEIFFGTTPNGRNWTAYRNLHTWIKVQTADYLGLDGVYFYVKSGNQLRYQDAFAASSVLSDGLWHELVIDLTNMGTGPNNGVAAGDVQLIGFELLLHMAPPAGAPATPSQAVLLVDDIWLEALPPSDGGVGGQGGGGGGGGAAGAGGASGSGG